ncbi:hypothetical protein MP228_010419 [Amoeboaphelidium protococcarum]|nr:hypothetical protein MP228_010419 [Amoeboaphelidium protococcarum]
MRVIISLLCMVHIMAILVASARYRKRIRAVEDPFPADQMPDSSLYEVAQKLYTQSDSPPEFIKGESADHYFRRLLPYCSQDLANVLQVSRRFSRVLSHLPNQWCLEYRMLYQLYRSMSEFVMQDLRQQILTRRIIQVEYLNDGIKDFFILLQDIAAKYGDGWNRNLVVIELSILDVAALKEVLQILTEIKFDQLHVKISSIICVDLDIESDQTHNVISLDENSQMEVVYLQQEFFNELEQFPNLHSSVQLNIQLEMQLDLPELEGVDFGLPMVFDEILSQYERYWQTLRMLCYINTVPDHIHQIFLAFEQKVPKTVHYILEFGADVLLHHEEMKHMYNNLVLTVGVERIVVECAEQCELFDDIELTYKLNNTAVHDIEMQIFRPQIEGLQMFGSVVKEVAKKWPQGKEVMEDIQINIFQSEDSVQEFADYIAPVLPLIKAKRISVVYDFVYQPPPNFRERLMDIVSKYQMPSFSEGVSILGQVKMVDQFQRIQDEAET